MHARGADLGLRRSTVIRAASLPGQCGAGGEGYSETNPCSSHGQNVRWSLVVCPAQRLGKRRHGDESSAFGRPTTGMLVRIRTPKCQVFHRGPSDDVCRGRVEGPPSRSCSVRSRVRGTVICGRWVGARRTLRSGCADPTRATGGGPEPGVVLAGLPPGAAPAGCIQPRRPPRLHVRIPAGQTAARTAPGQARSRLAKPTPGRPKTNPGGGPVGANRPPGRPRN
jgi:hypothetical protein